MTGFADIVTRESHETPPPESERDLLDSALDAVRARLPESWLIEGQAVGQDAERRIDASVRLLAPGGEKVTLAVETKRLISTRDVPVILAGIRQAVSALSREEEILPVLVARYLSPATRAKIAGLGAGYVDATGNVLLRSERPAMWLADRGLDRDPWRGPGRPRGSLKGSPAARVVRALVDFAPPYPVPELARRADSSTGAAYRIVKFLEEESLLTRERYGPITDVRWRELLERWSRDYGFEKSNRVETFLEPRGLNTLVERLAGSDLDYVVTGSLAAERAEAYAPARLAAVYVRDLRAAIEALDLRRVEAGANVALAVREDEAVYARSELYGGLRVAALSQVAVDLLTGPGRNPNEAEALLDWMSDNEPRWRR